MYKGYQEKKEELEAFQDDFDELDMRVKMMQPIVNSLEDKLDSELNVTLEIAKTQMEIVNKYLDGLFKFCEQHKSQKSKFFEVAKCVASTAIDAMPDGPLKDMAGSLSGVVGRYGVPEKALTKFAEKITFLTTCLGAAASTMNLNINGAGGSKPKEKVTAATATSNQTATAAKPSVEEPAATDASNQVGTTTKTSNEYSAVDTADVELTDTPAAASAPARGGLERKSSMTNVSAAQKHQLAEMLSEQIEEEAADVKVMVLHRNAMNIFNDPDEVTLGLWLKGTPYIVYLEEATYPKVLYIMPVDSSDTILEVNEAINNARFSKKLAAINGKRMGRERFEAARKNNPDKFKDVIQSPIKVKLVGCLAEVCFGRAATQCYMNYCSDGYLSVPLKSNGTTFNITAEKNGYLFVDGKVVYQDVKFQKKGVEAPKSLAMKR